MSTAVMTPSTNLELKRAETTQSMTTIVIRQFLEHRMAVAGAIMILILSLVALCAPLIASFTGLDPSRQNVGQRYLLPFTETVAASDQRESDIDTWTRNNTDAASSISKDLIAKNLATGAETDAIYTVTAMELPDAVKTLKQVNAPRDLIDLVNSWKTFHIFGTDEIGRDVFIRLVYASRVSLGVGVLVSIVSALIGFLIGALAGFYGGVVDTLLMRITDALLSLPQIPVLIVFAAIDMNKIPWLEAWIGGPYESIFKMVIILCIFSWMQVARLVRGSILTLRERDFVLAARTLGASDTTIITRHMFPNVIAPMLVSVTLGVGDSILEEAALSFLGLGIMPPTASWGNMLNNAQEVIYNNMWLAILPGCLILITVVSFNFFGDGLQDAMDPKAIRR